MNPFHRRMSHWARLAIAAGFFFVAAPSSPAQAQVTYTGCAGGAFADGCSLLELANNNGTITVDLTKVEPPVRLIVDRFNLDFIVSGTPQTDFDKIRVGIVAPDLASALMIGLKDEGGAEWHVSGGGDLVANSKRDAIEYRVRAFEMTNGQTGQPADRINEAQVCTIFPEGVSKDPNPPSPIYAAVRDIVSDRDGTSLTGTRGLVSLQRLAPNAFKEPCQKNLLRTAAGQHVATSEVTVLKEVVLEPGFNGDNLVGVSTVIQFYYFTSEKEIGFLPATIHKQDGGVQVAEAGVLPAGQHLVEGPVAAGGAVAFLTDEPSVGAGNKHWQIVGTTVDGDRTTDVFNLETLYPHDPANGLNPSLQEFDPNGLGQIFYAANNIAPSGLIDFAVAATDLRTGETVQVLAEDDEVLVSGIPYRVRAMFGNRTTDSTIFINASLNRNGNPAFDGVLGTDIQNVFAGGAFLVSQSYGSGASLDTPTGTDRLGDVVNILAAHETQNHAVLHSIDFGGDEEIFVLRNGRRSAANRVAGTGDPVNGAGDEVRIFDPKADVDAAGDVAVTARIGPSGQPFPTKTAAGIWTAPAGIRWPLQSSDAVPGHPDAEVTQLLAVGINDDGRGALTLSFTDPNQGLSGAMLQPFSFNAASGMVTWDLALLTTGDTIQLDGETTERVVNSIILDPRGVGGSTVAASIGFEDGAEAIVEIPLTQIIAIVPDVNGFDQASAEAQIAADGFVVGMVSQEASGTVPAGDVISQSPAAGTEAAPGSAVDLVVSSGPALATVPDVIGRDLLLATLDIEGAGLVAGNLDFASNEAPTNEVIGQAPAGGAMVPFGSPVDLVVSTGPEVVIIRGDLDGDGVVGAGDVILFRAAFGSADGDANFNPAADLDGDGRITINDLRILRSLM